MSTVTADVNASSLFTQLLGAAGVERCGPAKRIVLRIAEQQQVAEALRVANERKLTVAVRAGKRQCESYVGEANVLLDLSCLNKLEHYDPGDLTLGVEAGATVSAVQKILGEHGQMLPLGFSGGVSCPATASIGGVLATADHGPMSSGFGAVRDFCIGIAFVTGDGVAAHAGGRVVKNVAGYDLMKLLIGSHGTLAVITSANFKVFPAPRKAVTFSAEFSSPNDAAAFAQSVRRSPLAPACLELLSPFAREYCGAEKSAGPRALQARLNESWMVLVRGLGTPRVLQRYRTELLAIFPALAELSGAIELELWQHIADMAAEFRERHPNSIVLDITCPSKGNAAVISSLQTIARDAGFIFALQGRLALGNFVCGLAPLAANPPEASSYAQLLRRLRSALPTSACAVVTAVPVQLHAKLDRWGTSPTDLNAMRTVKQVFDPHGILGQGRFFV